MSNEQLLREALQTIKDLTHDRLFTAEWAFKHGATVAKLEAALAQPAEGGEVAPTWWMRKTDEGVEWTDTAPLVLRGWTPFYKHPPASQEQAVWCEYVAGMTYGWLMTLKELPPEDRCIKAISGIIERRLWALKREASQEQAQQPKPQPMTDEMPPDGMKWFYCTTNVTNVSGHQLWRVAARSLEHAMERFDDGYGDIVSQEVEVTDLDEPEWEGISEPAHHGITAQAKKETP